MSGSLYMFDGLSDAGAAGGKTLGRADKPTSYRTREPDPNWCMVARIRFAPDVAITRRNRLVALLASGCLMPDKGYEIGHTEDDDDHAGSN